MIRFNLPTPLEKKRFKNIDFLLKRDDLINPHFSGNKARKIDYYVNNFSSDIKAIISYGSIQSNAMYSLSYFAKEKGINFRYYANHIPSLLKSNPDGNYKLALLNGAKIIEGYENLEIRSNELLIKEGISNQKAYYGIRKLAKEIVANVDSNISYELFLPSGTGATALFLSKALKELNSNINVFTTPCVGDSSYLKEQFFNLEKDEKYFPTIINSKKKYYFGKLYKEFYQIWLELQKETMVEFDLLYDTKGWITILENKKLFKNLIYIHQGGLLGNITMIKRYKYKFGERI